ncbi:MAG: hypothetical protein HF962_03045, partial [Sulfurovum sp.]|nr:hypothetical protein [Sulfurovum sp.]
TFTGDPSPITYTVDDVTGNTSNVATVTIDYPQDAPVAVDDHKTGTTGDPVIQTILDNDTDDQNDTDPSTVDLNSSVVGATLTDTDSDGDTDEITVPNEGTWVVDNTGELTFTPLVTFTGDPTPITYTVDDVTGNTSNVATVTIDYPQDAPSISLTKLGTFMDENGDGYADIGETIGYEFNITNTGDVVLTNVSVTDANAVISGGPIVSLAIGQSDITTFTGVHTITEQDIIDGKVLNQATVAAQDPSGNDVNDTSDDPQNPVDHDANGDGDPDDETSTGLAIKGPISTDDNISVATDGDASIDIVGNDSGGTFDLDPATATLTEPANAIDVITDSSGDVIGFTIPGEGIWSVDETTGVVTFSPESGYVGDPTPVEYTIEDTQGNPTSSVITINYPPVANDDSNMSLPIGETASMNPIANDQQTSYGLDPRSVSLIAPNTATDIIRDSDGDIIGFVVPDEGEWLVDEDTGVVTFVPSEDLVGSPTVVNYTIRETNGDISNEATLSVTYIGVAPPVQSYIGDTFWVDRNGNGVFNIGEEPIVGATVELLDSNGGPLSSCPSTGCIVQTDANGHYEFDVDPGSYQVRFTLPTDLVEDQYIFSANNDSSTVVSDNTLTYPVTIAAGESNMDIDVAVDCGCANLKSDSVDSLGMLGVLGMVLATLLAGFYFMRREERYFKV